MFLNNTSTYTYFFMCEKSALGNALRLASETGDKDEVLKLLGKVTSFELNEQGPVCSKYFPLNFVLICSQYMTYLCLGFWCNSALYGGFERTFRNSANAGSSLR